MAMHLLHGNESIACIGQACGFSDQSAFTRKFKAETGFSPRAYRARIGGNVGEPVPA
jgi:AraC-like DNA-binding protein